METFDHSGEPPDRDRFAALLIEGIRQAGETRPLHYDPATSSIRAEGRGTSQFSFHDAYKEYQASSPDVRALLVRNFIRTWFTPLQDVLEDYEAVQHDLLPAVRSRGSIEISCLRLRAEGAKVIGWPYRPLAEHLSVSLVYDLPASITSIHQGHLDNWKVEFEQALVRAKANLASLTGGHGLDRVTPGVWRSPWRDNHDTARLVLLDLIRAHKVTGDPVAMIPNRDTLLLTGADDRRGLVRLAEIAEKAWEHPRSVSGVAVRLRGDDWEPFLPPENHPAYGRLHRLQLMSLGGESNTQAKALDAWYEKEDEDIYVSPCTVVTDPKTGASFSYSVWTDTVHASLPVAEVVFFVRVDNDQPKLLGRAPWARVREQLGALMTPQDLYPARFEVSEFPSEEQLKALVEEW
jgi:hypothetical protein